ncbi:type II 3-dehydroquinate dehydratase [Albimonas pacifica]|uniref:3-dehydroquinate dehydratase n=1 Tax=Albimonas pacifica TaxID=1114924 RepID=A0A1I3BEP9_9RHOB|nr:type II 3-dehydroquinate dehydratase [Albimonas pacifica]SFH60752.1 3-dehydroquinate dehydratase [Albimonas pacifica]
MSGAIWVLNGPNLNRLGKREPEIYGRTTLAEVEAMCRAEAGDFPLVFRQTNSESELIGWIHEAIDEGAAGVVINPAAFTFYSMAVMDALKMVPCPLIELHISNVHKREEIYHHSLVSPVATAVMAGLGARGYRLAVRALIEMAGD